MKYCVNIIFLFTFVLAGSLFCQDSNITIQDSTVKQNKHTNSTPADTGFYIRSTDGVSYLRIYGSIRLNGAYDFKGLQSEQTFSTYDISTGGENIERRFFMSPYQTRLGFNAQLISPYGIATAKLETDFLGTDNSFRIRHAYGTLGAFLLGQTWSVFSDPYSIPNTVDPDGPNSCLNQRAVQVRYEPKDLFINWALALESPRPEFSETDSTLLEPAYQTFPDVTSMLKIDSKWGFLRLAGVFRSISVRNIDESVKILAGYGGLFSGIADITNRNKLYFQITGGKGISRYISGLTGEGQDVVYDETNNTNVLLPVFGGFVSGSHRWSKGVYSDITAGLLRIINKDFQPGSSFKESYYFSLNTFISIRKSVIGIEFDHGARINKDGSNGYADRLSFIGIVNF